MNSGVSHEKNYKPIKLTFKQAVMYRQKEFPRERVYQIFSPKRALDYTEHKMAFRINSIPHKENLTIANLPIEERAKMQKYNIYCTQQMYLDMLSAPKYVFDTYHFNYTQSTKNGPKVYSKTYYYMVAPTLYAESDETLPVLYRLGVSRDLTEKQHFSFSIYAVAGGYEDGFFFLGRLDNDIPLKSHIKKIKNPVLKNDTPVHPVKCENNFSCTHKVPFPHFHRPRLNDETVPLSELDQRECSEPYFLEELKGADFDRCLTSFLESFNISPTILLAEHNCKITEVIRFTQNQILLDKIRTMSATQLWHELQNNTIPHPEHSTFSAHDFIKYAYCVDFNENNMFTPAVEQKCGSPYLKI